MENLIKKILEKEKILYHDITKSTSSFTNIVYIVDDKFVIKLSKNKKVKKKLEKEISVYKNIKVNYIPSFIASGKIKNYQYLIVSKLKGTSLYSVWHTFNKAKKEYCIKQIANMLKNFHQQNFDFLNKKYRLLNWTSFLTKELKTKSKKLKKMGFNTIKLNHFIAKEIPVIFAKNTFGLVHNDVHFDNIIYDNEKLYLIDFDRVLYCPTDYEMLIFKTMCDNPAKFVGEENLNKININDFDNIYDIFRIEYSKLFIDKAVDKRILTYQFNYLLNQAINCKDKNWIRELLNSF